jgi:transposase-like protein
MELDAAGLRRAAGQTHDADAARRMLALALVLDGHSRIEAATLCGMDRQTLRDWVHRYNEFGLPGLSNQVWSPGPPCRLTPEQEAEVARLVQEGPDLAVHGVIRWRRIDLSGFGPNAAAAQPRRAIAGTSGLYFRGRLPGARHRRGARLALHQRHAMNLHMAGISRCVTVGAHAVITLDGAGWGIGVATNSKYQTISAYCCYRPMHPN